MAPSVVQCRTGHIDIVRRRLDLKIVNRAPRKGRKLLTIFMSQSFGFFHYLKNFGHMFSTGGCHRDEQHCVVLSYCPGHLYFHWQDRAYLK